MSSPAEMTPHERNEFMMAKIRSTGVAPSQEGGYVLRVLSVPGRVSGLPRSWPIAVVQVGRLHHLCAPNRRRQWVRNLLAAGWCEVEGEDRRDVTLLEDDGAAEVVSTYLRALGRPSTMWPFPSDAPVSEIRKHLSDIAVFRLGPATALHPVSTRGQASG